MFGCCVVFFLLAYFVRCEYFTLAQQHKHTHSFSIACHTAESHFHSTLSRWFKRPGLTNFGPIVPQWSHTRLPTKHKHNHGGSALKTKKLFEFQTSLQYSCTHSMFIFSLRVFRFASSDFDLTTTWNFMWSDRSKPIEIENSRLCVCRVFNVRRTSVCLAVWVCVCVCIHICVYNVSSKQQWTATTNIMLMPLALFGFFLACHECSGCLLSSELHWCAWCIKSYTRTELPTHAHAHKRARSRLGVQIRIAVSATAADVCVFRVSEPHSGISRKWRKKKQQQLKRIRPCIWLCLYGVFCVWMYSSWMVFIFSLLRFLLSIVLLVKGVPTVMEDHVAQNIHTSSLAYPFSLATVFVFVFFFNIPKWKHLNVTDRDKSEMLEKKTVQSQFT